MAVTEDGEPEWTDCAWEGGSEGQNACRQMEDCPLALVWPAVFEDGVLKGGFAHPWRPVERKVDMAEVCCGLATWSWVGLGGGIRTGPVIDNDLWCCRQAEQQGSRLITCRLRTLKHGKCCSKQPPGRW